MKNWLRSIGALGERYWRFALVAFVVILIFLGYSDAALHWLLLGTAIWIGVRTSGWGSMFHQTHLSIRILDIVVSSLFWFVVLSAIRRIIT